MRPILSVVLAAACCAASASAWAEQARVIVKFKAQSSLLRTQAMAADLRQASQAEALGRRHGLALKAGSGVDERTHVVFADGLSSQALADRLSADADVESAVPDRRRFRAAVPNDPRYAGGQTLITPAAGQWYLRQPDATLRSAINAEQAWDVTVGSPTIVVAVLDTGIRFDHPDLAGNLILQGYDMVDVDAAGPLTANDGNGRDADASDPGDWITQQDVDNHPDLFGVCAGEVGIGSSWHGTQASGIIGALTDNNVGMASVGRTVRVLPVRVLGKCGGYDSDIIAGMRWAAGLTVPGIPVNANPANVINMSLGGSGDCGAYTAAVAEIHAARPGVVIVASAGNDNGHPVSTPAKCPGVVAVGGLRHTGTKVGYSQMGPEVAISAPAGNCVNTGATDPCLYPILTTTNAGTTTPTTAAFTDGLNDLTLGTSFSAPLVAGTAALVLSVRPTLTHTDVLAVLKGSARAFPTTGGTAGTARCPAPLAGVDVLECYCTTSTCGAGMLDARAAVVTAGTYTPPASTDGGGGGGGSLGLGWLIALAAAVVALGRARASRPS